MKNFYACQPSLNYGYANPDPNHPWEQGVNEPGPGQNRMPVFHVSLSHDGSVASAVVVLQMEDRPETDGI